MLRPFTLGPTGLYSGPNAPSKIVPLRCLILAAVVSLALLLAP